jgi:hypothetical protein
MGRLSGRTRRFVAQLAVESLEARLQLRQLGSRVDKIAPQRIRRNGSTALDGSDVADFEVRNLTAFALQSDAELGQLLAKLTGGLFVRGGHSIILLAMYLAFVDESGDPGLRTVNSEYPMFGLAAVVCLEREYAARIEPQVRQLTRSFFDADVRLNARNMAKQVGPFASLASRNKRRQFGQALSEVLTGLPITVMAACLNKRMHQVEYGASGRSAYDFTLPFLMERLVYFMAARHDSVGAAAQAHGKREDAHFKQVWQRHLAAGSYYHAPTEFGSRLVKLEFRPASEASAGLQLADLAAAACARFVLDPEQPNTVFSALSAKLYQGTFTEPDRFGLKVIP